MRKAIALISAILCTAVMMAHPSWQEHAADMYEVFGFEERADITRWMKYISSDLIDGYNKEKAYAVKGEKVGFYDYLKSKYPDFKCKHRLLFHWGYNSLPWSAELQKKVEQYEWPEAKVKAFQQELINEQKKRNRKANEYTEQLFGFAPSGKEAAKARALISIAYDVHILGDYTPDNKDTDGLSALTSVIGDLINNIRVLEPSGSKEIVTKIQKASRTKENDPIKAQNILNILKRDLRGILRMHNDKRIRELIVNDR